MYRQLLCLLLMSLPLWGYATVDDLFNQNIPAQQFEEANNNTQKQTTKKAPTKPATATQKQANPQPNNTATPVDVKSLQAQFDQLNQNVLLLQQRLQTRLEVLETKNQQLEAEVARLQQALVLLNQEINNNTPKLKKTSPHSPSSVNSQALTTNLMDKIQHFYQTWQQSPYFLLQLVGVIILALLILLWIVTSMRPKKNSNVKRKPTGDPMDAGVDDTQDEYDYMGSNESAPAKLNLARAYIAMEDYVAAKNALLDVLQIGDQQQRQEAESLINSLPKEEE